MSKCVTFSRSICFSGANILESHLGGSFRPKKPLIWQSGAEKCQSHFRHESIELHFVNTKISRGCSQGDGSRFFL